MAVMKDILLDIQYLLKENKTPAEVARELEIPVSWVFEAQKFQVEDADSNPDTIINS